MRLIFYMQSLKLSEQNWLRDYLHFFINSSHHRSGRVDFEEMYLHEMPIYLQSCFQIQDQCNENANLGAELMELYWEVFDNKLLHSKIISLLNSKNIEIIEQIDKPFFETKTSFRVCEHEEKKFCIISKHLLQSIEVDIFCIMPFQASEKYIHEQQKSMVSLLNEFKKII